MEAADFSPPWWLSNSHAQSLMASIGIRRRILRRRAVAMLAASEETILEVLDGVRLHGLVSRRPHESRRPMAVLIHGWEGSSDSLYLMSAATHLYENGFDVFRLHLRDHGPSHHLNEGVFHSCRIDEAVAAVAEIQSRYGDRPLFLAGFSLGGNFSVRIAVRAPAAGIRLQCVVAVCPVLNPEHTLKTLESGWPVYRFYFLRKWQRSLRLKARFFPDLYDATEFAGIKSLLHLTDYFVREHSEYPDSETYFKGYAITGQALQGLAVRTHMILSEDDPIIPVEDLADVAQGPALTIARTARGGHCGYLDSVGGPSWADREMLRRFSEAG